MWVEFSETGNYLLEIITNYINGLIREDLIYYYNLETISVGWQMSMTFRPIITIEVSSWNSNLYLYPIKLLGYIVHVFV